MDDHIVKEETGDMRVTGMLTGNDPGAVLRVDDDYLQRLKARDEHLAQWAVAEIESLRQRVKEYKSRIIGVGEVAINSVSRKKHDAVCKELTALKAEMKMDAEGPDWIQRAMQAEAQLDALKAQQDRPICYLYVDEDNLYQVDRCDHDTKTLIPVFKWSAPTIPEGYVLVPVEPTPEMIKAGQPETEGHHSLPYSLWKAMIAASPKRESNE